MKSSNTFWATKSRRSSHIWSRLSNLSVDSSQQLPPGWLIILVQRASQGALLCSLNRAPLPSSFYRETALWFHEAWASTHLAILCASDLYSPISRAICLWHCNTFEVAKMDPVPLSGLPKEEPALHEGRISRIAFEVFWFLVRLSLIDNWQLADSYRCLLWPGHSGITNSLDVANQSSSSTISGRLLPPLRLCDSYRGHCIRLCQR